MARLLHLSLLIAFVGLVSTSANAQGYDYYVSDPTGVFTVTLPDTVFAQGFYLSPTNLGVYAPSIYATDNQDWHLYLTFYARDRLLPLDSYPLEYALIINHWFSSMLATSAGTYFPEFNQLFLTCTSAWMLSQVEEMLLQAGAFQQPVSFEQLYSSCEQNGLTEGGMITDSSFDLAFAIPGSPQKARLMGVISDDFVVLATHFDFFAAGNSQLTVNQIINSLQFDNFRYDPYTNPSIYSQFKAVLQPYSDSGNPPEIWQPPALPQSNYFDECLDAASGGDFGDYSVCLNY